MSTVLWQRNCTSQLNRSGRSAAREADGRPWLVFLLQTLLVVGVELADDIVRGLLVPADRQTAVANALRLVHAESARGLWVEPGVQRFFEQSHGVGNVVLTWQVSEPVFNGLYALAQTLFALLFAVWLFQTRRALWPFVRNVFLLTNVLALVLYESYPVAPPRLTPGLSFDGRPFSFVDTAFRQGPGGGLAFNEYSAMPSLHVAWALIIAGMLVWTARSRLVRCLAPLYPVLILLTTIVTGNHYLLDGLGAAAVVLVAVVLALAIERRRTTRQSSAGPDSRASWPGDKRGSPSPHVHVATVQSRCYSSKGRSRVPQSYAFRCTARSSR